MMSERRIARSSEPLPETARARKGPMETLTKELKQAIERAGDSPVRLTDPETRRDYVLVSADVYERMRDRDDRPELAAFVRTAEEYVRYGLADRVDGLEAKMSETVSRLEQAEAVLAARHPAISVPITTLAPEPFELIAPIVAVVQESEGSYIASFLDANLGASGETKAEALDGLKDRIVTTFERFERKPDDRLGPGPLRQKHVLTSLIRRR
jgi:hypothetical protein